MLMWLCETYQTERYCICRLFCSARDHSSHSWTIQHDSAFGISQCLVSIPTPREMAQELRAHDLCYYIGQSQCPPLTVVQWFTLLFSQMTLRPPYPHFQIRLRLFFILAMENEWLKPISYFLEAIHMDCNDITPEACHSRHNFSGCLAKEPDSGVMLIKLCDHIQMAACKHLLLCFVQYMTWPNHSTGLHRYTLFVFVNITCYI